MSRPMRNPIPKLIDKPSAIPQAEPPAAPAPSAPPEPALFSAAWLERNIASQEELLNSALNEQQQYQQAANERGAAALQMQGALQILRGQLELLKAQEAGDDGTQRPG